MKTDDDFPALFEPSGSFESRHIGPSKDEIREMLEHLGLGSLPEFLREVIPEPLRCRGGAFELEKPRGERELLAELRELAKKNEIFRSFVGCGYHDTWVPAVILRNILEEPCWYTQYTPYQAEIAQGRLEMLLNFQTMICELTGLELANASLLDEGTAAAEAMAMSLRLRPRKSRASRYFVSEACHPQTIEVLKTRAATLGVEILVGDHESFLPDARFFGALVQFPATDGTLHDYGEFCRAAHQAGILVTVAADILSLCLFRPPGEVGADIAVGSTQRFGVPMGYGGPHAAYFATREEFRRQIPGRLVGVSVDSAGRPAFRLAIQTREQHIRRHRATSNICTAQVLLAVVAAAYAIYHGPAGLLEIAGRVRRGAHLLRAALEAQGEAVVSGPLFDTLRVTPASFSELELLHRAWGRRINLRGMGDGSVCISLDETTSRGDLADLLEVFGAESGEAHARLEGLATEMEMALPKGLRRSREFLSQEVFALYHTETEMLRYLKRLEARDLSLAHSMIPLGSCTMKLNGTAEMIPLTWPEFGGLHPFAPLEQSRGYQRLFADLERWLADLTGFDAVTLQPNAGSQGEYTGLLAIRAYHASRGQAERVVCLIPASAHGTNPASAVMAGLKVVAVACDENGNIDIEDLEKKAQKHSRQLAALMVTYPSTHGVFEEGILEVCRIVHDCGGQVYLDGANMNALVGLCKPAEFGADICHLNLHKTFAIPHGGGGPGVGPVAAKSHLAKFLPGHPLFGSSCVGPVSAAPWGSASILPISWSYIRLMGVGGLARASAVAMLSANYVAKRLEKHYPVVYRGKRGFVAHECIIDLRPLKKLAGIDVDDVAKRLMDYGFHAPTMSWPVAGTMMIEPTESESKAELDRFCEAMISIREEIREIEKGDVGRQDNLLKNAPHSPDDLLVEKWEHPYGRQQAAFPLPWIRERKFWPAVARIDNAYGDRHLLCTCPTVAQMAEEPAVG